MTFEFNVDRFFAQLSAFSFSSFHMIDVSNMDEIESYDLRI